MTCPRLRASFRVLALLVCVFPLQAAGDAISFTLTNPSLVTNAGGDVVFQGTVTNNSGTTLNASDFFFNFFSFNPSALAPSQDLGLITDFPIPNMTTSATVDLFDVLLCSVTPGSSFQMQVQLEDINGDLSAIQTITVSASGASAVPEPGTAVLVASGVFALLARKRNHGERPLDW